MQRRTAIYARSTGTSQELEAGLRRQVEARGDVVVAVFADSASGLRRDVGWRPLVTSLDQIDHIVLNDIGDLPGRTVKDLLAILTTLTAHGASIAVPPLGIDTSDGMAAIIALTAACRRAKKSAAIKRGQERARKAGRRIGRPPIPATLQQRILTDLAAGAGVRSTARKRGVSPASVSTIKRSIQVSPDRLAA